MTSIEQNTSPNWRSILEYRQDGTLLWLPRPVEAFKNKGAWALYMRRFCGKEAGNKLVGRRGKPKGISICVSSQKNIKAHRIIWEMFNGPVPDGMVIDHINGDPWDNRIENLRLLTPTQNSQNRKHGSHNNNCGAVGVYLYPKSGRYRARITAHGKKHYCGTFDTPEEAHKAYVQASRRLLGDKSPYNRSLPTPIPK